MDGLTYSFETPETARRGLRPRALVRVLAHIEANAGERHTLASLAEVACVSRFHFARMFRRSMGCTVMAYLTRVRIELAKPRLLENESLSVLAASLGFCDQSHFTRVFRRATGVTPKRYLATDA